MGKLSEIKVPVVMSIAGFDPSGGAGVLADARTFAAFNCFPTAAITSITFQNNKQVYSCVNQNAETLRAQIMPILLEGPVDCVKTGMLPTREIVLEVADLIRQHNVQCLVVDPVMKATSGYQLADKAAIIVLKEKLLPLARVVTPNIPEAEDLVGFSISDEPKMRQAAELIREMGPQAVLLKGGHLTRASEALDLLVEDGKVTLFRGEWIKGGVFHGTGCMLSAAIAACLARGTTLEDSVRQAKSYVSAMMRARVES